MGQCASCIQEALHNRPTEEMEGNTTQSRLNISSNMNHSDGYSTISTLMNEQNHATSGVNIDSFEIKKVIGRGSFGKVYMVQKKDTGEFYAMKTLKKDQIIRKNQKQNTKGIITDLNISV